MLTQATLTAPGLAGLLGLAAAAGGPGRRNQAYQFYRIVPLDILEVFVGLGFHEFTPAAIEDVLSRNLWRCVDELVHEQVDCINLRGVPVSAQLGRERVLDILRQI